MSVLTSKDIRIPTHKLLPIPAFDKDLEKARSLTMDENITDSALDCDRNTESETEAELSDIPSNSDDDTEEEHSENQLDSEEVRYKLKKLSGPSATYARRKSVGTVIPNWLARNHEAFKRGKEVCDPLRDLPALSFCPSFVLCPFPNFVGPCIFMIASM